MKKIALLLLLVFSTLVKAQNTTVNATVVDSDGTTWANGTWSITFQPNPNYPAAIYNINGTPLSPTEMNQQGVLTSGGGLSVVVYNSTLVSPIGSSWSLNICPQASSPCGNFQFQTSGSSMNISSNLTSIIPAPRFKTISGSFGYNITEAQLTGLPGSTFYNVTLGCQYVYSGAVWSCMSPTAGSYVSTTTTSPQNLQGGLSAPLFGGIVYASSYGMLCNGSSNDTTSLTNAITAAGSNGIVQLPLTSSPCLVNITIATNSPSNVWLRGMGRRSTILQPYSNAPVITIDSTSGQVQSVTVTDMGFYNNGFTSPAIYLKGSTTVLGNSAQHRFENLFFCAASCTGNNGFKNTITIGTGVENSKFVNLEIDSDQNNGIEINSGADGDANALEFDRILVQSSAANGIHITSAGTGFTTSNGSIAITNSVIQLNSANGLIACNAMGLNLFNDYFENNSQNNIYEPSTDSSNTCQNDLGLSITGGFIWGAGSGYYDVALNGGTTTGSISGNFFGSTLTFQEGANWASGVVYASGNSGSTNNSLNPDSTGNYHLSINGAIPPVVSSSTGTITPSVSGGVNFIRMTNSSPATITNFTGGSPGQQIVVFNDANSTVTFNSSNTNGIFIANVLSLTLINGQSASFIYNPNLSRWIYQYNNGPLPTQNITTTSIGGSALAAGACSTGTTTLSASATGHLALATESDGSNIGGNYTVRATVSGTTVTINICAIAAGTPAAETYNVMVF